MAVGLQEAPAEVIADVPTLPIYRFSVQQYLVMIREDIVPEDARVELLGGWLVQKMTKHQPHSISSGRLSDALTRLNLSGWYVAREEPVIASDNSMPEPDLMIVRGDRDDYPETPPPAGALALVIEVADASLGRDEVVKKAIYATAAVPTYWLVNLQAQRIEVYTDPSGPAKQADYRSRKDYGSDDEIPLVIEGREIARWTVRELLPKVAP